MKGAPRSERFDDVYFSADDGLAETNHVFIEGNGLPAAWQDRDRFVIAETGFGTGLNFLAAWDLFSRTARPGQFLDYISVEKYPLSAEEIDAMLAPWEGRLNGKLRRLVEAYPLRVPGFHRIVFDRHVALTLIFDDVKDALPQLQAEMDCWFLDGFAPARNPDMWTPALYAQMARLSRPGTRFATFTAAGEVKRGLRDAGFSVEKVRGYGRKRDMLIGWYHQPLPKPKNGGRGGRRVAIVGGGLAGTACAHVLPQYGFDVTLYDSAPMLASGASGNALGIVNPRLSALRAADSDFYTAGYAQVLRTVRGFVNIDFAMPGSLHLVTDADKQKRFDQTLANWGWHNDHMRLLDARATSEVAGVDVPYPALHLPESVLLSPQKLCAYYAQDCDFYSEHEITDPRALKADAVILASGASVAQFAPLDIHTVRGQISYTSATESSAPLRATLCYGGYISPAVKGTHALGSTFQKWLSHSDVVEEDHADNLAKLAVVAPALAQGMRVVGGRAAFRTASRDRFPVVGALGPGLYATTAHGSHGILSSLAGAHVLADLLRGGPFSLPQETVGRLSPERLIKT